MKKLFGIVLVILGVVTSVYIGLFFMFLGGIVQIVEALEAPRLITMTLAVGVARVAFAGVAWGASAVVLILPGYYFIRPLNDKKKEW